MSDRPWMQSLSGGPVDLIAPRPEQIIAHDIAQALARIPRFNGHTREDRPWSVAQHSLLVHHLVVTSTMTEPRAQLYALLHDAHEAFIGDITSPVKEALAFLGAGTALRLLVTELDRVIHARYGLDWPPPPHIAKAVKEADLLALAIEQANVLHPSVRPWGWQPGHTVTHRFDYDNWGPDPAFEFHHRLVRLSQQVERTNAGAAA